MQQYIAILRGINVGGKRKILMNDLKALLQTLGFKNCTTYIQSGNVIFSSPTPLEPFILQEQLAKAIYTKFGFEVPVIIRTAEDLQAIISNNPFIQNPTFDIERLHVTFLGQAPTTKVLSEIKVYSFAPDKFIINKCDVFVYCSGKYSDSKLTNAFFEKKLKVPATTRNWKTILKLYEMAS